MPIRRPDKIDVGVGVYRDGAGNTPILRAVKAAEKLLWEQQQSKSYIGGFGDKRYTELLRPIVLGRHAGDDRIAGLAYAGRLRGAEPRLQADRHRPSGREGAGRHADLAQPCAGDRGGRT